MTRPAADDFFEAIPLAQVPDQFRTGDYACLLGEAVVSVADQLENMLDVLVAEPQNFHPERLMILKPLLPKHVVVPTSYGNGSSLSVLCCKAMANTTSGDRLPCARNFRVEPAEGFTHVKISERETEFSHVQTRCWRHCICYESQLLRYTLLRLHFFQLLPLLHLQLLPCCCYYHPYYCCCCYYSSSGYDYGDTMFRSMGTSRGDAA